MNTKIRTYLKKFTKPIVWMPGLKISSISTDCLNDLKRGILRKVTKTVEKACTPPVLNIESTASPVTKAISNDAQPGVFNGKIRIKKIYTKTIIPLPMIMLLNRANCKARIKRRITLNLSMLFILRPPFKF